MIVAVFEELAPADFIERRAGDDWQLLDVREPWELEIVRLDDAVCIPMAELPARLRELDAERPVAVLCHSGGRSARVAGWLAANGFDRVANISGGIDAWATDVDSRLARY